MKCPKCGSESLTYLKKKDKYFCDDCEFVFSAPTEKKKIFLSYGHDTNETLVNMIKDRLNDKFDVWIDKSRIKGGDDWRRMITDGIVASDGVIAFLSKHSTREPGVCLDEIRIALNIKYGNVLTVLLEPPEMVKVPSTIGWVQYLDFSNWKEEYKKESFHSYFDAKMEELLSALNNDCFANFKGEIEELQRLLTPNLSQSKEQMLLKSDFYGREWLLNIVEEWRKDMSSNVLFIFGGAGFGKSSFVSHLAHYKYEVLATMYIEWDKENQRSPIEFIKSLAFKIATKLPDYRKHLIDLLNNNSNIFFNNHGISDLFEELIAKPLNNLIDGERDKAVILIDGLDEASDECTNEIAFLLAKELTKLPKWIGIILTSRPDEYVSVSFKQYQSINLNDYVEENNGDIQLFINEKLSSFEVDKETNDLLLKKINGNFLYASLLVNSLIDKTYSIDNLEALPNGLESFYYQNFRRFFPNQKDFVQTRNVLEVVTALSDIPRELIMRILDIDSYILKDILKKCSSFLTPIYIRESDFTVISYDFCHKSISDFLCSEDNCDYYVSKADGLNRILNYFVKNICFDKQYFDSKEKYFSNYICEHICGLFIDTGKFDELVCFLIQNEVPLFPYFLVLEKLPSSVNISPALEYLWNHKLFIEFLRRIQSEGRVKTLKFFFRQFLQTKDIEEFNADVFEIYIDTIHLSGDYERAVGDYEKYLSRFDFESVMKDNRLSRFYIRMLHHSMFFKDSKGLLEKAKATLNYVSQESPNYLELLFLIGGNLGCLNGDFINSKEYLLTGYDFALRSGLINETKRFVRKLCDVYLYEHDFDASLNLINKHFSADKIKTRYDVYLLGVLSEIYRLSKNYHQSIYTLDLLKKECDNRGLLGWKAHEMIGRALTLINEETYKTDEILECLRGARELYNKLNHYWGLVNEAIVREIVKLKANCEIDNDLSKTLEIATKMNYNYEVGIIKKLLNKHIDENYHLFYL